MDQRRFKLEARQIVVNKEPNIAEILGPGDGGGFRIQQLAELMLITTTMEGDAFHDFAAQAGIAMRQAGKTALVVQIPDAETQVELYAIELPSSSVSVTNHIEDVVRQATLFVEAHRVADGLKATDSSRDWARGKTFQLLAEAVDAIQKGAVRDGDPVH